MSASVDSEVVIVGAGIGGLAAALALQRAGVSVRVLERAASPRELGFALLLAPNAMHALRRLGIADTVISGGCQVTGGEMRRADGTVLRRFTIERVKHLLPEPIVTVLRPVLHGALLDAVGAERITLGRAVVGFTTPAHDEVHAVLEDGRRVSARYLIGADGVGSVIRKQLHPAEAPPRSSGLFGLRGVAHGVAHHLGDIGGAQYFGRGVEAGLGRAGGTTVYWYISLPRRLVPDARVSAADILERVMGVFDEGFRRIVGETRPDEMRLDELFDREPIHPWGDGGVTLLGDAAHPMLPHAGQGAAQALEDAVALGDLVGSGTDRVTALRAYERHRAARTRRIVMVARRNARIGSMDSAIAARLRDLMIRLVPESLILKSLVAFAQSDAR